MAVTAPLFPVEDSIAIAHLFSRDGFLKGNSKPPIKAAVKLQMPNSAPMSIAHLFSRDSFLKASTTKMSSEISAAAPNQVLEISSSSKNRSFVNVLTTQGKHTVTPVAELGERLLISDEGGFKAVKIPQSLYNARLEECKHSIIGRITLVKGEIPWKHSDLKLKLNKIWGFSMNWKLISLGRGFYHIVMPSDEALQNVRSHGALPLKPGIMRFTPWSPGFDPGTHKCTTTQVWVRFYNLPWEFWDKRIMSGIARAVGVPVRFDRNTIEGELGHFARMLIDIDLSKDLQDKIRVDTDSQMHWVYLEYERLPELCSTCSSIGHSAINCRRNINKQNKEVSKDGNNDLNVVSIVSKHKRVAEARRRENEGQKNTNHRKVDDNNCVQSGDVNLSKKAAGSHTGDPKTSEEMPKVLDSQSDKSIEIEEVPRLELHDQGTGKEIIPHADVVPLESPLNIRPLNISIDSPVLQQVEQNSGRTTVSWANQGSSWADQFGSDSDSEDAIDTEQIEQLWHSQITHSSMYENVNSDPDGWYTVKRKTKYTPVSQIEIPVSRDTRSHFRVGTRKSNRQVRLPKKLQPP